MKKEIKKKWVKALRSGKYKQAKGTLNDGEGGFCCLGVLCDIYGKEKKKKWSNIHTMDGSIGVPNHKVMKWAGIKDINPQVNVVVGGESRTLAGLNDGRGYGFKRIAKIIEKQL